MPADDCPRECKAYPYCSCGQERRFALNVAYKAADDGGKYVIKDKLTNLVYRSWVLPEMNKVVKLMNKMTGVSR